MNRILNTFKSTRDKKFYYELGEPVFKVGDWAIYPDFSSYIYAFKNIAVNCLVGLNRQHLIALSESKRPEGVSGFLYDRAMDSLKKGQELTQ